MRSHWFPSQQRNVRARFFCVFRCFFAVTIIFQNLCGESGVISYLQISDSDLYLPAAKVCCRLVGGFILLIASLSLIDFVRDFPYCSRVHEYEYKEICYKDLLTEHIAFQSCNGFVLS
ncbi:hypothetical protein CDAR_64411 [Caerostris darwini]|uniref:Uncharacterized protein n=1 Tax=Caerostris darwini TaxID=1538125 RepID=A0AAV4V9U6_9ARAC|nr:hypothetical protein CDAR_64411 [Caerostris darwini]